MVDAEVVVASKLLEGWVELGDGQRGPGETGGEVTGQSLGGRVSVALGLLTTRFRQLELVRVGFESRFWFGRFF